MSKFSLNMLAGRTDPPSEVDEMVTRWSSSVRFSRTHKVAICFSRLAFGTRSSIRMSSSSSERAMWGIQFLCANSRSMARPQNIYLKRTSSLHGKSCLRQHVACCIYMRGIKWCMQISSATILSWEACPAKLMEFGLSFVASCKNVDPICKSL